MEGICHGQDMLQGGREPEHGKDIPMAAPPRSI